MGDFRVRSLWLKVSKCILDICDKHTPVQISVWQLICKSSLSGCIVNVSSVNGIRSVSSLYGILYTNCNCQVLIMNYKWYYSAGSSHGGGYLCVNGGCVGLKGGGNSSILHLIGGGGEYESII